MTDIGIWLHSREGKPLFYSKIKRILEACKISVPEYSLVFKLFVSVEDSFFCGTMNFKHQTE